MKLGLSSYTYTWGVEVPGFPVPEGRLSAHDLLKKTKGQKLEVLQIADNLPLHLMTGEELENFKQSADALGIELEVGTRGIEVEQLLRYLEIAQVLGSKFVRTIIHTSKGTPELTEAIELIQQVIPSYEKAGIALAIENHDRHTVDELIDLLEAVDSPYIGICLDTVNSFGALEAPEFVVKKLAPYTINLHFKDFKVDRVQSQMGFSIVGCPAGEGQLDIDMVMNELSKYGKNPNVILELWTPYEESVSKTIEKENEWANKSIAYLKERV
ncbi:sugar phosphate isomerase/epimerase family protein [Bacillus sp. Marseille-P3661]|uniref:sugar phosphate isomerase/epimerase family protein n=1 Tax=Bacillus sp. Marseille-P3661 TaxID=1936234 RepID=UPI000C82B145|nr:sugar phosphate isomerase/epimerase family protein [Bacillus sp. Marseille-P3661]